MDMVYKHECKHKLIKKYHFSRHQALIKWKNNVTCVGEDVPSADGGMMMDKQENKVSKSGMREQMLLLF